MAHPSHPSRHLPQQLQENTGRDEPEEGDSPSVLKQKDTLLDGGQQSFSLQPINSLHLLRAKQWVTSALTYWAGWYSV